MDSVTRLLYIILVFLSGISSIFAPIGLICSYYCLKKTHLNLKILTFILGTIWCLQAFSAFFFIFIIDSPIEIPLLYQTMEFQIPKILTSMCSYGFRLIEISIALERFIATLFFQTYETKTIFRIFPIFAAVFSIFFGFCFSFLFNIHSKDPNISVRISTFVIYIVLVTIEAVNFILIRRLQKQNQSLRKLSKSANSSLLTSKYQIVENIRSLNHLLPQATISFILSTLAIASAIIFGSIYEPNRSPLFFRYI